jgi:site-specific recombinase XerD
MCFESQRKSFYCFHGGEAFHFPKTGLAPIYVRITLNGQRSELSLGMRIKPEAWNKEHGRVIGKTEEAMLMNNKITQVKAKLEKTYFLLTTQFQQVTVDMIKKAYQGKPVHHATDGESEEAKERKTFIQAVDFEIDRLKEKQQKGLRAKSTIVKWNSTKAKLIAFLLYRFKQSDIQLELIKPNFADDMLHFFMVETGLDHNTAMKYIRNTKQVLTTATGRWIKRNPIRDFRCKYIHPQREVLTIYEILKIYQKPLLKRLDEVRDVFLFSCFTGLAYREVFNLAENDIVLGNDGSKWIQIKRVKSGNPEDVPLLPIPEAIIEKYRNSKHSKVLNRLLPVNSNVKYNAYLKELADLCGIDKKLTTHIARHTFATTITLENDVPLETVSRMLGHKSIRTTQIYAKITKKKISNDMTALRKKLFLGGELKLGKRKATND